MAVEYLKKRPWSFSSQTLDPLLCKQVQDISRTVSQSLFLPSHWGCSHPTDPAGNGRRDFPRASILCPVDHGCSEAPVLSLGGDPSVSSPHHWHLIPLGHWRDHHLTRMITLTDHQRGEGCLQCMFLVLSKWKLTGVSPLSTTIIIRLPGPSGIPCHWSHAEQLLNIPCTLTSPGKLRMCIFLTVIPFQCHSPNSCSLHCPTSLHEKLLCFRLIFSSITDMSVWQFGWLIWTFLANMHGYCYQFRAKNPLLSWPPQILECGVFFHLRILASLLFVPSLSLILFRVLFFSVQTFWTFCDTFLLLILNIFLCFCGIQFFMTCISLMVLT